MASRAARSFLSRRSIHLLSLSSFNRLLSPSSRATSRTISEEGNEKLYDVISRRYFGFGCGVGQESLNKVKGQIHSLASLSCGSTNQLSQSCRAFHPTLSLHRSFASGGSAAEPPGQKQSQEKKDISTVEDPFDSPTYHIPEKPVTFTEGVSYSLVILVGLGIFAAAAYGVCKELIFEPKEYKIFNKALERIQSDSQVRVRIGSPIIGYGQEVRNRSARQRVPHRAWTDEDGVEHIEINFHIRGPNGDGKVFCEMFKDKVDKQWKYMYLVVNILHPHQKQLFLESFLPAPA